MRCYRVRGKGVRGLYQKVTVQGSGENPPRLSLFEANSLCWLQLWYSLYKHTQPGAPQPRQVHLENPTCFPSLASQVSPPSLQSHSKVQSLLHVAALSEQLWDKDFGSMFIPSLFFDGTSYFCFGDFQNWFCHPDSRKKPVRDNGTEHTAARNDRVY